MRIINILIYMVIGFLVIVLETMIYNIRKTNKKEKLLKAQMELFEEKDISISGLKALSEKFKKKHKRKYNEIQIYLSRIGANYLIGRIIDPIEYIGLKLVLSILFGASGLAFAGNIGLIVGVIIGYKAPGFILGIANERDNDAILGDIRSVYETLRIKTESGMFLTTSVRQCYKVVSNKRLKKALLELSGELGTTNNVKNSIDLFQMKFKNRYVDQLCITLRQGFDSGSTLNGLTDIANNLNDIQKAIELDSKNRLEKEVMCTQLLILFSIMATIMYVVMVKMSDIMSGILIN